MQARVNGEDRELAVGTTVGALLAELGLNIDGVAVAINLYVVPRGQHAERIIAPGDHVEIIRAVGGG
ncbi:MAG: sulfur carrier protein [Myxococcota bacterium]|jgi:sulfur carrier protein